MPKITYQCGSVHEKQFFANTSQKILVAKSPHDTVLGFLRVSRLFRELCITNLKYNLQHILSFRKSNEIFL